MRATLSLAFAALFTLATLPAAQAGGITSKPVVGWVEKGIIMPWGVTVKLKMDSGALTSSMHAENVEKFKKNGEDWVRFTIELEDEKTGKKVKKEFEREVLRKVKLSGAGGVDRRVSVLMQLCIAATVYEEQFTLADRDRFNYPVLLGRRTIEHLGYIDVSRTFTLEPSCDENTEVLDFDELKRKSEVGL